MEDVFDIFLCNHKPPIKQITMPNIVPYKKTIQGIGKLISKTKCAKPQPTATAPPPAKDPEIKPITNSSVKNDF
jgi:hypothetical protein